MTIQIDTKEIEIKVPEVIITANRLKITSHDDYVKAVEFGKSIKKLIDQVVDTFKEPKELASKTHRSICAQEKKHLEPLDTAIKIARKVCGDWQLLQDNIKKEAERKAREEAEAEAVKLRQAEIARKTDERLKQAAELEALGFNREAEQMLEVPVTAVPIAPVISMTVEAPKVKGTSTAKKYEYEITDVNLIPREYLIPNEKLIGSQVRAFGANFNCPGVKVYETRQVSFSGK